MFSEAFKGFFLVLEFDMGYKGFYRITTGRTVSDMGCPEIECSPP